MENFVEKRNGLRRTRSVRASLRMLGNKFKNSKNTETGQLNSSLEQNYSTKSSENSSKKHIFNVNNIPEQKLEKNQKIISISNEKLNRLEKNPKKYRNCDIYRTPAIVAPKAAALLHIPSSSLPPKFENNYLENRRGNDYVVLNIKSQPNIARNCQMMDKRANFGRDDLLFPSDFDLGSSSEVYSDEFYHKQTDTYAKKEPETKIPSIINNNDGYSNFGFKNDTLEELKLKQKYQDVNLTPTGNEEDLEDRQYLSPLKKVTRLDKYPRDYIDADNGRSSKLLRNINKENIEEMCMNRRGDVEPIYQNIESLDLGQNRQNNFREYVPKLHRNYSTKVNNVKENLLLKNQNVKSNENLSKDSKRNSKNETNSDDGNKNKPILPKQLTVAHLFTMGRKIEHFPFHRKFSEENISSPKQYTDSVKTATIRRNSMWTSKLQSLESSNNNLNIMDFRGLQPPTKVSKKLNKQAQAHLEKLKQINIHLQALFSAVEHGHLEKARTILESTDVDVNSVNSDGLSPLDVAVLSNNRPLAKMLVNSGAREGNQFISPESLGSHLKQLLQEAEHSVQELGGCTTDEIPAFNTRASFSSIIGTSSASYVTGCAGGSGSGGDSDKQLTSWERRAKGLRRMLLGFDQARPPDTPMHVEVDVVGERSVVVRFQENSANDGPITTKYRVQWSSRGDFSNICGERDVLDTTLQLRGCSCRVDELTQGRRYFFRASCGNLKGWGLYRNSTPSSVVASSWRDVERRDLRFSGRLRMLDDLFGAVRLARPEDASDIPLETPALPRRNHKKKTTIKQLFTAASKFQKNLRRGVYMACILYHEDKVLVTNEDFLPVIEVDETYPSCINTDYHWLMKVACTWDDVKSLRTDMEKNASSAIHFRTKLLTAAAQMQSALCIQDLGQVYYKPLRDNRGTLVVTLINHIRSPKSISVLNSRWLPLNKINKKNTFVVNDDSNNINDILMASIQEQISYHQVSSVKLPRGLYLGYLKMQSSVDSIQVVVPTKTPNVLPHCKVRDNPHVSAEEWEHLKSHQTTKKEPNEVQKSFVGLITSTSNKLFKYMEISNEDALSHRLYDVEVIELNSDVSFILICPAAEFSCSVPGQREILLQRGDFHSLPIQAFEMIHLKTYQNQIIQKYSRLSCILELDSVLANSLHREAFSSSELQTAKERLAKIQTLQTDLNAIWKSVRWLIDVITFTRDRSSNLQGIAMKNILTTTETEKKSSLLQLPNSIGLSTRPQTKSTGRGSWPGPVISLNNSTACLLSAEFSKSEQHLSINPRDSSISNLSSQYLSASDGPLQSSRKSSADSNFTQNSFNEVAAIRLPPSRSEDTLLLSSKQPSYTQRKRATTVSSSVSATSSPLLNRNFEMDITTCSVHSLSSDSESSPMSTSTPNKKTIKKSDISTSKSMSNVKEFTDDLFKKTSVKNTYLKPTLNAIQNENKYREEFFRENSGKVKKNEKSFHIQEQSEQTTQVAGASTSSANFGTEKQNNNTPGILQVYAAYETGLASGTSLKLHVTPRTSAREVVDLVVKQLNMAVVLKGREGPIYTSDKLKNFCLVAVIGARERCLRDDFKPLQLQNPWRKGRLYVRQKHDLLAAIEHSSRHTAFL